MSSIETILEMITCPISAEVMIEPVIASDGQTYDKKHILEWLSRNSISPITREPLNEAGLYTNTAVKFMCDKYFAGEFNDLISVGNDTQRELALYQPSKFDIAAEAVYFDNHTKKLITSFGCTNLKFEDIMNAPGIDLVMIIDLSGSTSCPISAQDENGNNLESGFSINDILRHTGKTVIAALRPQDRVAFIVFDDVAHNIFDFMSMTELNKITAKDKIHNQKPNGGLTNIWGGCEMALQMLENRDDKSRNSAAILLTDGRPTKSPARGEKDKMISYKKTHPFPTPLYGFGFGYGLQPYLLNELCVEAVNGAVSHISDGSMVATVFNNTIGLIVNTACMDAKMIIRNIKDIEFNKDKPLDGNLNYAFERHVSNDAPGNDAPGNDAPGNDAPGNDVLVVYLGATQYEQSRETVLNINPLSNEAEIGISYTYSIGGQEFKIPEETIKMNNIENKMSETEAEYHYFRTFVVDCLTKMNLVGKKSNESLYIKKQKRKQLYEEVNDYYAGMNLRGDNSQALFDTWKDQVYIAAASDDPKYLSCYDKWGMYYFEQLICALSKQYTPNFKDEACKIFGGKMFDAMVDMASDAFDKEPPPERSCLGQTNRAARAGMIANLAAQSADMSQFNNYAGGCFTGDTLILIHNDKENLQHYKRVDQIKPGDMVQTICDINKSGMISENRQKTKVLKVIETKYQSLPMIHYVSRGGTEDDVGITHWHPIKFGKIGEIDNSLGSKNCQDSPWGFPKESDWWAKNHNDMYETVNKIEENLSVFTFILEIGHVVFLGKRGIMAITLAHHYKNGVLNHAYFGTDEIKKDLEKIPGWEQGHVVLRPEWFKKSGPTTERYNLPTVGRITMGGEAKTFAMIQ